MNTLCPQGHAITKSSTCKSYDLGHFSFLCNYLIFNDLTCNKCPHLDLKLISDIPFLGLIGEGNTCNGEWQQERVLTADTPDISDH